MNERICVDERADRLGLDVMARAAPKGCQRAPAQLGPRLQELRVAGQQRRVPLLLRAPAQPERVEQRGEGEERRSAVVAVNVAAAAATTTAGRALWPWT
jgi:hypothetical protein